MNLLKNKGEVASITHLHVKVKLKYRAIWTESVVVGYKIALLW